MIGFLSCSKNDETLEDSRLVNKANKEAGEKFLIENKSNAHVTERASGLQYSILSNSESGEKPLPTDSVRVSYSGQLIDGTLFADTTETVLLAEQILGFQEGVSIMQCGSRYKFFVPYYLAYAAKQQSVIFNGENVTIKPYSVLIFEITLNSIIR